MVGKSINGAWHQPVSERHLRYDTCVCPRPLAAAKSIQASVVQKIKDVKIEKITWRNATKIRSAEAWANPDPAAVKRTRKKTIVTTRSA